MDIILAFILKVHFSFSLLDRLHLYHPGLLVTHTYIHPQTRTQYKSAENKSKPTFLQKTHSQQAASLTDNPLHLHPLKSWNKHLLFVFQYMLLIFGWWFDIIFVKSVTFDLLRVLFVLFSFCFVFFGGGLM